MSMAVNSSVHCFKKSRNNKQAYVESVVARHTSLDICSTKSLPGVCQVRFVQLFLVLFVCFCLFFLFFLVSDGQKPRLNP